MDSLKIFKGYDKVVDDQNKHDNLEDQKQQQHQKHQKFPITTKTHILIATISTITTLFLILTLSFSLIHHRNHHTKTESQSTNPLNSTESIRVICIVTRFPESCITAISSSKQNPTDPKTILKLSLHASINELVKLSSTFSSNSKIHAFDDCKEQIDDAVSRLNDSVSGLTTVGSDGVVTLTDERINDIQTWVSAALTDQETCVDGLQEVGSSVKDEVKRMMKRSSEYVSNSLAIVANLRTLLKQFHVMPLH